MITTLNRRRWSILVPMAMVFGFATYLSRFVDAPFMFHDEFGYVAVGRVFGPGPTPELYGPLYHPAYGILLAPFDFVTSSGAALHRFALTLNAVLVACLVPLLSNIGVRIARLEHLESMIAAVAGATTAAILTTAQMLVAESLLVVLTAASILTVDWWMRAPNEIRRAGAAGTIVGLTYLTHPRSLALVVGLVACGLGLIASRNVSIRPALTALGSLTFMILMTRSINGFVLESLYPFGPTAAVPPSELIGLALDQPLIAVKSLVGTAWYASASTLGLAPLGLIAVLLRLRHTVSSDPIRGTTVFLLAGAAASMGLSVLLVTYSLVGDPARSDFPLYGRYLEQWIPIAIVFAVSIQRDQLRKAALLVFVLLCAGWFVLRTRYDEAVWLRPAAFHNVAGVTGPRHFTDRFDLAQDGIWFVLGTAALLLLASILGTRWMAVPCALLGSATSYFLITDWAALASENAAVRHRNGDAYDIDMPVDVDLRSTSPIYFYNLQYWNDDLDLDLSMGRAEEPAAALGTLDLPPTPASRLLSVETYSSTALWIDDPAVITHLDELGDLFPLGFQNDQSLLPDAAIARVVVARAVQQPIDLSSTRSVTVNILHAGTSSPWVTGWSGTPVRLGTRLWNESTGTVVAETRADLFSNLTPGDSVDVEITLPTTELLNDSDLFALEIGVVQEGVAWLSPPAGELNPRIEIDSAARS